ATTTTRILTFADDVQPILNATCVACHTPGGRSSFTPLTSYQDVRFGRSNFSGAPLVVPGNPDASLLVSKIAPSGTMYPNLGIDLATRDVKIKTLRDWIIQGAFNTMVGPPTSIAILSGNNQSAAAGMALPAPFVVAV